MTAPRAPGYVCGHTARELERLRGQGAFFEDITRRVFDVAGLRPGLRVLDIGCGAGDVSLLAGRLVTPDGSVLGVDLAPEAITLARARAAALGLHHVAFRHIAVEALELSEPVDALVGRFVLMHQADPARTLRQAARHVRPGGLVVLLESHMRAAVAPLHSWPASPTYDRIMTWMVAVIEGAGAHTDMGLRLYRTFVEAGLPAPELWLQARAEGGPDADIYRYTAESARSLLPAAERQGITAVSATEIDSLEVRLRDEVSLAGGVLTSPLIVGAWCRLLNG